MYPGPLARGGMQQYGVAYSTATVNPTGAPQSFMMPVKYLFERLILRKGMCTSVDIFGPYDR